MSGLKEIRKKISSVNNTQKTTRAMKLVSTSKLKKADEMARRATVFAGYLNDMFDDIISRVSYIGLDNIESKFISHRIISDVQVVDIVCITSDKGLCGGFNSNTIKSVMNMKKEYEAVGKQVRIRCIGKKGIEYFTFNKIDLVDKVSGLSSSPSYEDASKFILLVVDDYLSGKTDEVIIIHNGFKNLISQELRHHKLLPLIQTRCNFDNSKVLNVEPDDDMNIIIDELAQKYIEYNMYYALLDSLAAEHGARMQAMESATNNASALVKSLTISYNKARQQAITTELVEINAGVEAMK